MVADAKVKSPGAGDSTPFDTAAWVDDVDQELRSLNARGAYWCGTFGGTANALTATVAPLISALTAGMRFYGVIAAANTGGMTLDVNTIGIKNITEANATPVQGGTYAAGDLAAFVWDGTQMRRLPMGASSARNSPSPNFYTRDEKAQNTAGGTFTTGSWVTRTLNTATINDLAGAALSSNQFTLQAGTYWIEASAPAHDLTSNHQTRIQNVTDGTTAAVGTSERTTTNQSGRSFACGLVTISSAKAFELQHRCATTSLTAGLGNAANFTTEIYAEVRVWKVGQAAAQYLGIPGGAGTFRMVYDTATGGGDPGNSKVTFNSATIASITTFNADDLDYALANIETSLQALFNSTSSPKARVRIEKRGDPTKWVAFDVTVMVNQSGYTQFTVTNPTISSGTTVPFTNGDLIEVLITPNGQKGDSGATGNNFQWSTSTTGSDPGSGFLRLNNATLASATALYISETDQNGNALATELARWDDGTSTIKGRVRIVQRNDPTKWVELKIAGNITDNGAWDTFTVQDGVGPGGFAASADLAVTFIPTGDKGTSGGAMDLLRRQDVTNVATIDFVDGASGVDFSTYDSFVLKFKLKPLTDDVGLRLQIGTGAGPTYQSGASDYSYTNISRTSGGTSGGIESAGTTFMSLTLAGSATGIAVGNAAGEHVSGSIAFEDPNGSDWTIFKSGDIAYINANGILTQINCFAGRYMTAGAITALRLLFSSGNVTGYAELYGIKKV